MTLFPTALEEAAKELDPDAWDSRAPGADDRREDARIMATAAITAYLAQAEKKGWVMVPKVPTDEMDLAGSREVERTNPYPRDVAVNVYVSMLAAAQNGGE